MTATDFMGYEPTDSPEPTVITVTPDQLERRAWAYRAQIEADDGYAYVTIDGVTWRAEISEVTC